MVGAGLCTRERGRRVLVVLRGELDAAGAAGAVAACPSGGQRVIIDLAAPEFIGCDALGALMRGQKLARRAGRAVLASPQEAVLRVLGLTLDRPVVRPFRTG
jgi:anti-anti-sigma factor